MADDAAIFALFGLILLQKFLRAGEGDLADVFYDLVGGHADAVVDDFQRAGFLVDDDVHAVVFLRGRLALHREQLVL